MRRLHSCRLTRLVSVPCCTWLWAYRTAHGSVFARPWSTGRSVQRMFHSQGFRSAAKYVLVIPPRMRSIRAVNPEPHLENDSWIESIRFQNSRFASQDRTDSPHLSRITEIFCSRKCQFLCPSNLGITHRLNLLSVRDSGPWTVLECPQKTQ